MIRRRVADPKQTLTIALPISMINALDSVAGHRKRSLFIESVLREAIPAAQKEQAEAKAIRKRQTRVALDATQ